MKKILSITASITLMLMFTLPIGFAQSLTSNAAKSLVSESSVQFTISIPDQWKSSIVREDVDHAVYFKFKKSDGSMQFLFSVNKVPANVWASVKDQIIHHTWLEQKEGMVYYSEFTTKSKISGADNTEYAAIYSHLNELISSIKITE